MTRLIRRTINKWQLWRFHRQSRREMPWLRELDNLETRYRKAHCKGAAYVQRKKREQMNAALRGEA